MKRTAQVAMLLCAHIVVVGACASMHDKFIETMNIEVAAKKTVEQHGYDPKYPHGFFLADEHYFASKERRPDGMWIYHFAFPMLTGRIICHYHLLVAPDSQIVVGWGFDKEYGDPEKTCRIAA